MLDMLTQTVQAALYVRWGTRLPQILAKARGFSLVALDRIRSAPHEKQNAEVERAVREAYMAGYRQAYLDGILDLMESAEDAPLQSEMVETIH